MFLARGNIQTVWDVLHEEKIPNMDQQSFLTNINLFGEKERNTGLTLFQMNTKFIMQFKNFMEIQQKEQQKQQQQKQKQQVQRQNNDGPIRLNIEESSQNYSITAEELHAERIGDFEKQLSQKQNEFSSLMTLEKPLDLNFSDVKDIPIGSEMEQLIASTLKQRNFDIEQIHNQNTITNNDSSWLKGKETSLKSEKINSGPNNKHISWSSELTNEEPNIFSKLKQVKNIKENNEIKEVNELKEINDKLDKIIKHLNIL